MSTAAEVAMSTAATKRPLSVPKRPPPLSFAGKLNARTLRQLQKAFEADPEVDFTKVLPKNYSSKLASRLVDKDTSPPACSDDEDSDEFSPVPLPTSPASIVHPLSDVAQKLLGIRTENMESTPSAELTEALAHLLQKSDLIWQSRSTNMCYVLKCSQELALKSIRSSSDFTEYTTLQYLQLHWPQIPVPRPHGLITSGQSAYLLMSYVPGVTLEKAWPQLQEFQKKSISKKIDAIFSDLRQLQRPDNLALGGVAGEGCKDTRRNTRISKTPLYTSTELWDFQYSNAPVGSKVYLEFLRRLTLPFQAQKCVFTHGDLRTANIIVQPDSDGDYQISGIIDWEMSGFYPEDFECTKITNTLGTNEKTDWYLHLPSCISPAKFPQRWLSDHAWDKQVV